MFQGIASASIVIVGRDGARACCHFADGAQITTETEYDDDTDLLSGGRRYLVPRQRSLTVTVSGGGQTRIDEPRTDHSESEVSFP